MLPDDGICNSEPFPECQHAPSAGNIGVPLVGNSEIAFIKTHLSLVLAGTDGNRTRVTLAQEQGAAVVRRSAAEPRRTVSRHGDLGHLEGEIATVGDDLRTVFDQLFLQA